MINNSVANFLNEKDKKWQLEGKFYLIQIRFKQADQSILNHQPISGKVVKT